MQTLEKVPCRSLAGLFDIQIEGQKNTTGDHYSSEAIGGAYGIAWSEYFKDSVTGEIYQVRCSDGVYGGSGAYSAQDEAKRSACYYALAERFQQAEKDGKTEIRISRNERVVMDSQTHAYLLETEEGWGDGKQSKDGFDGGLVGHFHGIPVICDIELQDSVWS